MATISQQLAEYFVDTTYDDIPTEVIACAKRLIVDTLAVAWAGTTSDGAAEMTDLVSQEGGRAEATLWGLDRRATAMQAAFVNGVTAAALDYDSLHLAAMSHASIVALPATLALAERVAASGREFLTAFILGNELHCRLGLSTSAHSGWFYTSMHGVFAAAAGGAKALGLDRDGICNALGVALSHVGGTQQAIIERSLTKRMQSAFAARNGVFSALLAERKVAAPREVFEGKFGFYAKYEAGDSAIVLADLGRRYHVLDSALKKFPSCACNHAAIEATLQLMNEHGVRPEDVERVQVVISPFMARLVAAPYDPSANPQIAAQFSVQYSVASAIMRGHLAVADIQPAAARDPALMQLARAVEVIVDDGLQNPSSMAAEVTLHTRSKGTLARRIEHLPGSAENPLSAADVQAKFRECTSLGVSPLSATQANALVARVHSLEDMPDVSKFFGGMAGAVVSAQRLA
ncbi:MAG TPA: MmgE/PrpD family protein [Casimicrobiaceae bacterium]|nr:MmgE/PrpD family protein [Casimicrobiaceae bacterium]